MDLEQDKRQWLERWESGRTGFHSDEVNPHLRRHWPPGGVPDGGRVLVPLAGKSRDLLWLAGAGYVVIGNELSQLAVSAFFAEAGIVAARRREDGFERWGADRISILCGDFFGLTSALVGPVDACYDRAALVALPGPLRERYIETLSALLAPGVPVLLIGIDYDPLRMDGPPYAVPEQEIRRLAAGLFDLDVMTPPSDMLADNPRFAERGLDWMHETVYCLRRADRAG